MGLRAAAVACHDGVVDASRPVHAVQRQHKGALLPLALGQEERALVRHPARVHARHVDTWWAEEEKVEAIPGSCILATGDNTGSQIGENIHTCP